jgi:hypothetical protein
VAGGLSNFNSIYIYDTGNGNLIGAYPTGSQNPDLIQFTPLAIGLGRSKTFLVRVSGLSSSAAGTVRIGFLDFTYATSPAPQLSNVPIYGNTLTLPGVVSPSPTAQMSPTPSPSSAASGSPAQSPSTTPATITVQQLPVLSTAVKTQIRLLRDGDLIRANNGPSVWIIRRTTAKISKRWVINLEIFKANNYSFSRVKVVDPLVLGVIPTSYLIRKSGDTKIYELTNVSEFGGTLKRWIRTADDFISMGYDFEAVYLVNEREFNLYSSGPDIYKK